MRLAPPRHLLLVAPCSALAVVYWTGDAGVNRLSGRGGEREEGLLPSR
jgi:hypothetical protein